MFDSLLAVPLHFTIEFLGFLVCAGGAILVLTRPTLVPAATSNRLSVTLGLLTLALAQVLHGGAFIQFDAELSLIAVKSVGFALVLVGLVGGFRPVAAAGATFQLREPFQLAPAAISLGVAAAALSGVRQGGPRELRRASLAFLVLALSEGIAAAAPKVRFGSGLFEPFAYSAHGLKLLGFVLLGSWFWSAVRYSIRTRFVASFGALLVGVILALSTALIGVISSNVQEEELERVEAQVANAVRSIKGEETRDLAEEVAVISTFGSLQRRVGSPRQARSLAREIRELDLGGFDFIVVDPANGLTGHSGVGPYLTDRRGRRNEVPEALQPTDVLAILGSDVVQEVIASGGASASPSRVGDHLALIASHAVRGPGSEEVRGVITIGSWLDAETVEGISDAVQPAEASLLSGGRVVASGLPLDRARGLTSGLDRRVAVGLEEPIAEQQRLEGAAYFSGFATLTSFDNAPVATLALSSPASALAGARAGVTTILFLAAMLVGAVALALAWLSGRRITRPIQALTATAGAIREGDLTAQAPVTSLDEVGELGETFNEMTSSLIKMTNDITEAAREEHNLRMRIETIIQSMADGLIAVDAEGRILAFNREAEALTGVPATDAYGKTVEEVVQAYDAQGAPVPLPVHRLAGGSTASIFLKDSAGVSIPITVISSVLRDEEGQIAGAVVVVRDMTREREVERMKTEFLSNISHELRTPLTPIKGYAQVLNRKKLPPDKLKQFVGGILESTSRLERIVELLVDFSAMEAGRMSPRSTSVDLSQILQKLVLDWETRAPAHEVVSEIEQGLPHVVGDARLLRRSLEEVLDNAVKFSPRGGTIKLEARSGARSNGNGAGPVVEVVVSDQGIGISDEDVTKIFSDFHQLDGSETRTFGGLGLGLAFVRRIVDVHSGSIEVSSAPDQGTRLTIAIPAEREVH